MTLDIMMPFYGRFDHLREAVNSVLGQEDPDWRLIVVDDVYPDLAPGEWVRGLDDPRIRYVRNDTNLRPSRNYIKSVGLAESEYVVIMGCDDVLLPGYIGRVRQLLLANPEASIVQPGVSVIDATGLPTRPLADIVKGFCRPSGHGSRVFSGEKLATSLLRGNWTYFPSLVWRTELVRSIGFRTDLDVVQDLAMLLQIITHGGSLVLDDTVVFHYRRHAASVSAVTGPDGSKFRQERTLFYESAAACEQLGWHQAARAARVHSLSRLNALTELPTAVGTKNAVGRRTLLRHILRRPYE